MRENDGKMLDRKALVAIRILAVERVEAGESPEVVIRALGMSRARIYEWLAAYHEGVMQRSRPRSFLVGRRS